MAIDDVEPQDIDQDAPELSLRETIMAARDELQETDNEKINDKKETVKSENIQKEPTNKDGKEAASEINNNVTKDVKETTNEKEVIKPLDRFPKALKKEWDKLPVDLQKELVEREERAHREFTKNDEERTFGRKLRSVIDPYMAIINAEGGTPEGAVKDLMNTAYLLRTGTPQQKGQLLLQVAHQFGADLRGAQQQSGARIDPYMQQLQNKIEQLEGMVQQRQTVDSQREQAAIFNEIDAFRSSPGHEYFDQVRPMMAQLVQGGMAKNLQEAYDLAIWGSPDIRSTLMQQQINADKEKRVAEQKAKADAARKASVSLRGSPGMTAPKEAMNVNGSVRDDLKSAFDAFREG